MPQGPAIFIEQGAARHTLQPGSGDIEVAESPALLTLELGARADLELDDVRLPVSWRGGVGACSIDLTNQVGFHRLRLRIGAASVTYDFRTSTSKATHDEVLKMAEVCAQHYLGFRRQFTYYAANGQRKSVPIPQIHFAWLRDRIDEVEALVVDIQRRPATTVSQRLRRSSRGKAIDVPSTIKLLRERPTLLEQRDDGPITVGGKCYWPGLVLERVRESEPASAEHDAIARFLAALAAGCDDLQSYVDSALRADLGGFRARLGRLATLSLFARRAVGSKGLALSHMPTNIERTDSRYGRLRSLRTEYASSIAPTDSYAQSIRGNLKDVSEIYQTFAAHVVGNALGLSYCAEDRSLRSRDASRVSMRSSDFVMGFDVKPPGGVLVSWRDASGRPADERPDISIIGSTKERSLILDAKFRVSAGGARAKQEDLFEMQGYLNSYGVACGGIIFPGSSPTVSSIDGRNQRLIELPLRASFVEQLGGLDAVHSYVRSAIHSTMPSEGT